LLWEEYLREHPEGYRTASSATISSAGVRAPRRALHIDHKAVEKPFVDYAGDKLAIVDPDRGRCSRWKSS
jgi:hypothetical protein